ncbi:ATP-binding protein [Streptomyces sp. NPDC004647]|uniref:AlbA family DNA-binding domain-containing protein n=1 Tax=Streptomyces sp. NPDC004647 TaxID=3154671 RepID=UPI0033B0C725
MARSWTPLHAHLGAPPSPLDYQMVASAVSDKLAESDDLDWKETLPSFARKPGLWNEFAKDVASMGNTRGGLLIYGVSDAIELVGIDLTQVNIQQLQKALTNSVQPYIAGVDFVPLPSPAGDGLDLLVVDVPQSEMAPHFHSGWEQRDKDRATFNAPYRIRDRTEYMQEHQIARTYTERFGRQASAEAAMERCLSHATETVFGAFPGKSTAWLVIAARQARPTPGLIPRSERAEAQIVVQRSATAAARLRGHSPAQPAVLSSHLHNDLRVGLRRWVETNFMVPSRREKTRGVMLELHDDGSVVVAVELSWNLTTVFFADFGVDTDVLVSSVYETVALLHEYQQARGEDSPVDITAAVSADLETKGGRPDRAGHAFVPFRSESGRPEVVEWARQPVQLLPVATALSPAVDDTTLRACAEELASGLLNQFGIDLHS